MNALLSILLASFSAGGLLAQTQIAAKDAVDIEAAMASGKRLFGAPLEIRRGFDRADRPELVSTESVSTDVAGIARVSTRQWERIVVKLPRSVSADHTACLMVNSKCSPLPVGASLDSKSGMFYWHVPNAFKGDFDLVFYQSGSSPVVVRVTATPEITTKLK
jgi:hypothetical protein